MSDFVSAKEFEERFLKFKKENEERFYEYGKRIAAFDSVREDIKSLNQSISDLKASVSVLPSGFASAFDDIKSKLSDLNLKHLNAKQELESHKLDFERLKKSHDALTAESVTVGSNTFANAQKLQSLASELQSLSLVKSSISANKQENQEFQTATAASITSLKSALKSFLDDINGLKSQFSSFSDVKDRLEGIKTEYSSLLKKVSDSSMSSQNALGKIMDDKYQDLKKDFSDKLSSIKIPETKGFADEARVAKIESQLDSIALDAKNAYLKSNNVDMQNQLNAKKLENIQLLLKQHELMK